jgi:hypothetical protein
VVSFTTCSLYSRKKGFRYSLDGRLGGTRNRSGRREEKNLAPPRNSNSVHSAVQPVAIANALSQLLRRRRKRRRRRRRRRRGRRRRRRRRRNYKYIEDVNLNRTQLVKVLPYLKLPENFEQNIYLELYNPKIDKMKYFRWPRFFTINHSTSPKL